MTVSLPEPSKVLPLTTCHGTLAFAAGVLERHHGEEREHCNVEISCLTVFPPGTGSAIQARPI